MTLRGDLGRTVRSAAVAAVVISSALVALMVVPHQSGAADAWESYVPAPRTQLVEPVAVTSTSGQVAGPRNLLRGRSGTTTLTMSEGGEQPVVVLDFGQAVGGTPKLSLASATGSPTLRASFSESGRFIDADGDNGGNGPCCGLAPPSAEPHRWNEWTPDGAGVLSTKYLQGSQRFVRLALTTPGTVVLRTARVDFKAFRAEPSDYRGWFLSSDRMLNRIWYAGAYTVQLNMVPPGVQDGNRRPQVVDGAKRDRAIWSGDLVVQNPVIWNTLGRQGSNYVKQSLISLAEGADPSGALPGIRSLNGGGFIYSESYSMHAADTMVDYYRYTGDREYARRILPVVRKQLEFIHGLTDERGLVISQPGSGPGLCCGLDWDGPYDGQKTGAVTATNAIFYHSLKQAAYLERQIGSGAKARANEREASKLRRTINDKLFDPGTGLYRLSDVRPAETGQDSNALAVSYGVAPAEWRRKILTVLKDRLWTPFGTRPFSEGTGYSAVISPFISGFETGARFLAGDQRGAIQTMKRLWGIMLRPGPDYSGAFWEKMSPSGGVGVLTGNDPIDNQSLAHGWSATPTALLSEFVLGATPVDPGYRTWKIQPRVQGLPWVKGRVPTRFGPIDLSWKKGGKRSLLRGRVEAPSGTRGRIVLPRLAKRQVLVVNGSRLGNRTSFSAKGGKKLEIKLLAAKARPTKPLGRCHPRWVTAWGFSPSTFTDPGFSDQTIRTVSYTHFGGTSVRLVLTNRFGDSPVTFNSITAGIATGGKESSSPAIRKGSMRQVRFGGKSSVTIAPGADVRSDPVVLTVKRGESVVSNIYSAGQTGRATVHTEANQTSYVATGNRAGSRRTASFEPIPDISFGAATYFLTRVEVKAGKDAATIVAMGDSLTNGTGSSLDGNGRYPDALARRFARNPRVSNLAVANAGIGGNQVLKDAASFFPYSGPSALHRLSRDVLSQPSLAGVLLIEGMNDVGSSALQGPLVGSEPVIGGLRTLAGRIHAAGKKVFAGTIPPTGSPAEPSAIPWYSTDEVDQIRREINTFIRSGRVFDGYFEVDRALRNPDQTAQIADRFNSGDGLHPNDAGYLSLAKQIKPSALADLGSCP